MSPAISIARGTFAPLQLGIATAELVEQFPTGRLEVVQGIARRYVWFRNGRIRAITSKVENERLGSWLATRGLVNRKVLKEILINKPRSERLGSVLVDRGLIDRARVLQELLTLAMTVAGRMVLLEGEYEAESGQQLPSDAFFLDAAPLGLFLGAARRVTDTGHFELAAGNGRRWARLAATAAGRDGAEPLPLESQVLALLDEARTLEELQAAAPEQAQDLARAVVCLAAGGLIGFTDLPVRSIVVEERAAPVPPPPSRAPSLSVPPSPMPPAPPVAADAQGAAPPPVAPPPLPQAPAGAEPAAAAPPPMAEGGDDASRKDSKHPFPPANPRLREVLARVTAGVAAEKAAARSARGADASLLDVRRAEAMKERAGELLEGGSHDAEARRLLDQAVETAPDADSLVRLANLEAANPARRHLALDHLKRAVELDPQHTGAWMALAGYWCARGESAKQRRCLEKVLRFDPRNEDAARVLAALQLESAGG
ncbi:MAG TPA: DUF4388 domain-containing protein [Thermoanaerobaculaceae bacterium]|nr:DUF4388 domain-containing protein [Thermoanaerobaculaceae bacterium]